MIKAAINWVGYADDSTPTVIAMHKTFNPLHNHPTSTILLTEKIILIP
jgi:hypothetical protein